MKEQPREYTRTEFWALVLSALIWLVDKRYGTDILSSVGAGELTAAKAQVLDIAAEWHKVAGGNPDLVLYIGALLYGGRKVEKIVSRVWGDKG